MSRIRLAQHAFRACLVGGAVLGVMVVMPVPEVRAACLSSSASTNCATFENGTSSFVENFGYTDTVFIGNTDLKVISFYQDGFTSGLPITLTDIAYSLDGGSTYVTTGLASTSYAIESTYTNPFNSANLLSSRLTGLDLSNFRIKYTIPASSLAPSGFRLFSSVVSSDSSQEDQGQTRSNALADQPPAEVPAQVPLLGVAAAFGFSRKLRRRIRQSA